MQIEFLIMEFFKLIKHKWNYISIFGLEDSKIIHPLKITKQILI